MPVAPPLRVEAPAATPSRYGLLTAADLIPAMADPHARNGIEWDRPPCGPVSVDPADCGEPADRELPDGIEQASAAPIVLYAGFTCRPIGYSEDELLARARTALAAGESSALEAAIWPAAQPPTEPWAADPMRLMPTDISDLTAGAAVPLVQGISMLEQVLGDDYAGVGVIHAPRGVAAFAAERRQVEQEQGRLVTTLGTRWSFGSYPRTGPTGTAAAAGTAWLVATGAVTIRRTDVTSRPSSLREALDTRTNQVWMLAERTYVVAWDQCVHAAVLVDLTS